MLLWALAHLVETYVSHSLAASNLTVDPSDFIYIAATFPVLLALSTTRETESLRAIFLLNCAQIALALLLSYVLLYRMSLTPAVAATVIGKIYGATSALLAIMALLRAFTWATREERQYILWLCVFLWTYLAVELGMDYATAFAGLKAGTLLDLSWSVPFALVGWKALRLPIEEFEQSPRKLPGRGRLLVEALCPMLITAGIFALAASITGRHTVLGLSAIFLLIIIQGVQAATVELHFLSGRSQLMEREQALRTAVATREESSLQDPLTGIATRRRFDAESFQAWRRAIRKRRSIALMMIDVDYFKGVNDRHGHEYGDECLVTIAKALQTHARRPGDLVARFGGEEFVLLLPDSDMSGASAVASRLHEALRLLAIMNDVSPFGGYLTVSIGIAVCRPKQGANLAELINCVDQALYQAKRLGRNRTCVGVLE